MTPLFFKTPADLRKWMRTHHDRARELLVGFYKKDSGKPSVTYHEALDEALAVGWIDGVRRSLSADSYTIRFTPRRKGSYWSQVNIARARALEAQGRLADAGIAAFEARDETKAGKYSFERKSASFDAAQLRVFQSAKRAWAFFVQQPPGYRRLVTFWVVSARREETRARRLAQLIDECANGRRIGLGTRRTQA
jgi:uncharacterized protein YdeI (YjbR/CyaY-like superfamily)